jgi:hypothetical protein
LEAVVKFNLPCKPIPSLREKRKQNTMQKLGNKSSGINRKQQRIFFLWWWKQDFFDCLKRFIHPVRKANPSIKERENKAIQHRRYIKLVQKSSRISS